MAFFVFLLATYRKAGLVDHVVNTRNLICDVDHDTNVD